MYALGIDLGTTYTAAATWRDGRAQIVSLGGRGAAIPSVVLLREDETFLTGEAANRRGLTEPHRVAREFKRRLGDTTPLMLGGAPHSAETLMSQLLRAVVSEVVTREGGAPSSVCVSHPANWGPYKIDLLRQAVRMADLPSVSFVSEPEAAAVNYAAEQRLGVGAVVAVYDLGGGTFDAAVLRRTATGFTILGEPEGIERLGGIDFDAAVFSHVRTTLGAKLDDLDEDDPAVITAVARLREECVQAKEALSADTDTSIPVLLPTVTTDVRLTRGELEAMVRPALHGSIEALRRAVRSAGLAPEQLHAVLLVGGSSRMPIVGQLVSAELGRPVAVDTHPKHAVALGAARLAGGGFAAPPARTTRPGGAALGAAGLGAAAGPGTAGTTAGRGGTAGYGSAAGHGAEAGHGGPAGYGSVAGSGAAAGFPATGPDGRPAATGESGGRPAAGGATQSGGGSVPTRPGSDGLARFGMAGPAAGMNAGPARPGSPAGPEAGPSRSGPARPANTAGPEAGSGSSPSRSGPARLGSTAGPEAGGGAGPSRSGSARPGSPAGPVRPGGASGRAGGGPGTRSGSRFEPASSGGGSRTAPLTSNETAPPRSGATDRRRRMAVLAAGVVVLVVLAGVGVGLAVFGGDDNPTGAGGPGTTSASSLPADEQCTDAITSNPRWVCLTSAIVADGKITIDYRSDGSQFNINGSYHLHIYGGDGTNPAAELMGMQAPEAEQGKWYVEDRHPAVLTLDDERYLTAIGDAPKVCARIADANHHLVPDTNGAYATGNCVPITRTAAETTTTKQSQPTHNQPHTKKSTSTSSSTTTTTTTTDTSTTTTETLAESPAP